MKRDNVLYGLGGLLIGIIITGFAAGYSVNHGYDGMLGMMGVSDNRMTRDNIDRNFIEQMIAHHEGAIEMAKLALQKSDHPEIRQLADDIISSQTAEIKQMQSWYKQWYGTEVPKLGGSHGMSMGPMMDGTGDIQRLSAAADFDKEFLDEMIPHHQMAVMMAEMLRNGTVRPEMKTLAASIITGQTKEINSMRSWQAEWGYAVSTQSSDGMMEMMR